MDPINIMKNISRAHVVIGALKPKNGKTPCVITEDMVRSMKKGAVIVDVAIDHGGCFETSKVTNHDQPVYTKHDVIHYCVPNIASNVSRTASYALSNVLTPILKNAADAGGIEVLLKQDMGILHGTYLYKGALTKDFVAKKFDLKFTDLELLLSADF
jgi:alanine dehydrogenase